MKGDAATVKRRVTDFFDQSATQYQQVHFSPVDEKAGYAPLQYRQAYIEDMIERQGVKPGARILDVGCGTGELAVNLVRKGYDVWAVDIAPAMVETTTRMLAGNGFPSEGRVLIGDVENLEFDDGFFDVVIASGVIEYQKTDEPTLSEMRRVVKPGGFIILNVTILASYSMALVQLYLWARRYDATRRVLREAKHRVLRREGELTEYVDRRSHNPAAFDEELASHGFEKVDHRYFHFSALPGPIDTVLGDAGKRAGRWMERYSESAIGRWLAGGYIVMARRR